MENVDLKNETPTDTNNVLSGVISSIELLKNDMESWKETLVENAKDNEKYSEGLLRGYNAAIRQVQNRLGKYCV